MTRDIPADLNDLGFMNIADASTTVITVSAGGVDRTIRAYALSELTERPDGMPEREYRARLSLQELVATLTGPTEWLPEGSLGPEGAYEASAARVFVGKYRPVEDLSRIQRRGRSAPGSRTSATRSRPAGCVAASSKARSGTPCARRLRQPTSSPRGPTPATDTRSCSDPCSPTSGAAERPVKSPHRADASVRSRPPSRPLRGPMTTETEGSAGGPTEDHRRLLRAARRRKRRPHRELELRYRGIIDRLPAVLYIDGVDPNHRWSTWARVSRTSWGSPARNS